MPVPGIGAGFVGLVRPRMQGDQGVGRKLVSGGDPVYLQRFYKDILVVDVFGVEQHNGVREIVLGGVAAPLHRIHEAVDFFGSAAKVELAIRAFIIKRQGGFGHVVRNLAGGETIGEHQEQIAAEYHDEKG